MQLGKYQKLEIIKKVEFGVYLAESRGEEERVLLPKAQVPVIRAPDLSCAVYPDRILVASTVSPVRSIKVRLPYMTLLIY